MSIHSYQKKLYLFQPHIEIAFLTFLCSGGFQAASINWPRLRAQLKSNPEYPP
jgi:hypothetical protein